MAAALSRVVAFVRLGRPQFCVAGVGVYGLGAAMAAQAGATISWPLFAWGQVAITATQLMTNYGNEYFDLEADRANATPTRWSGGSRVLPAGELPPAVALVASLVLGATALATVAVLGFVLHAPSIVLGLLLGCIGLGWAYSAPPLRLLARGLGEIGATVVIAFLTPLAGFALQTGRVTAVSVGACLPIACLQFAALLAIEFPDAAGDAVAGKRTLVLRLGGRNAARLYVATAIAPYALLPLLAAAGVPRGVLAAVCAPFPLAIWQARAAVKGAFREPERWEGLALRASMLLGVTTVAELAAFVAVR